MWKEDVIICGAVPCVILKEAYGEAEFQRYMRSIFDAVAPGDAFILGVADNIMPDAFVSRLERIAEMVEEWGEHPIDAASVTAAVWSAAPWKFRRKAIIRKRHIQQ